MLSGLVVWHAAASSLGLVLKKDDWGLHELHDRTKLPDRFRHRRAWDLVRSRF